MTKSVTWYEAFYDHVQPVQIDRYTEKRVWIKGRSYLREATMRFFAPTRAEAKALLIAYYKREIDRLKNSIGQYEERLHKVELINECHECEKEKDNG